MKASTAKGFREKIRAACKTVGTYKTEFEPVISRLADYYLRQRQLDDIYLQTGGQPMVKMKGSNLAVKNPVLDEKDKLNRLILDLERELGLTPASLRRVNEAAFKVKEQSGFSLALAEVLHGQGA